MATVIVDERVTRHSVPRAPHSDRGAAFESKLLLNVCQDLEFQKTPTAPYRSKGNELGKRTNRTIKNTAIAG